MKKWKIPVTWDVCSTIECEAPTLEEAMEYARDNDGVILYVKRGYKKWN